MSITSLSETPFAAAHRAVEQFAIYASDSLSLVETTYDGAQLVAIRPTLELAIAELAKVKGLDKPAIGRTLSPTKQQELADEAQALLENNFPLLHAHALIGLWGAMEAAIDDVTVAWIRSGQATYSPSVRSIKVSLVDFLGMNDDQRSRRLLRLVKAQVGSEDRRGIGQFESVLKALGVHGEVDDGLRRVMVQSQQMRHVIAHRGGSVDAGFIATCPEFGYAEGDPLQITTEQFRAVAGAASDCVLTLWQRVMSAAGETVPSLNGRSLEVDSLVGFGG